MKHLRRLCAVAVLTCAFAVSISAGDMHAGITPPPPPPQTSETVTTNGDMSAGIIATLLQSVLSVF